jgi:hypothetical protein
LKIVRSKNYNNMPADPTFEVLCKPCCKWISRPHWSRHVKAIHPGVEIEFVASRAKDPNSLANLKRNFNTVRRPLLDTANIMKATDEKKLDEKEMESEEFDSEGEKTDWDGDLLEWGNQSSNSNNDKDKDKYVDDDEDEGPPAKRMAVASTSGVVVATTSGREKLGPAMSGQCMMEPVASTSGVIVATTTSGREKLGPAISGQRMEPVASTSGVVIAAANSDRANLGRVMPVQAMPPVASTSDGVATTSGRAATVPTSMQIDDGTEGRQPPVEVGVWEFPARYRNIIKKALAVARLSVQLKKAQRDLVLAVRNSRR